VRESDTLERECADRIGPADSAGIDRARRLARLHGEKATVGASDVMADLRSVRRET
jgi:hypothetical protein